MKNQVIEITCFKPKANISQEEFETRNIRLGIEYAAKQPGFISRETGVEADGTWVIAVHWESLKDSQLSMRKFGEDPSVSDFNEMTEPLSFRMSVFQAKAFLKQ